LHCFACRQIVCLIGGCNRLAIRCLNAHVCADLRRQKGGRPRPSARRYILPLTHVITPS
jgi:hypothetical protein